MDSIHPVVSADHSGQTREKILHAASRLFAEHGYEKTSLAQVAREAEVSKALIFWHFDTKENLYEAALHRTLEPYFINVGELSGLDEAAQIERLIDLFYGFVRQNVYSVRFFFSLVVSGGKQPHDVLARVSELHRFFRQLLEETIESGRSSGRFRADADPAWDASLILAALDGILIEHFLDDRPETAPDGLLAHLKARLVGRLKA